MNDTPLRADCARCAALCCVALAFDTSDQFAFDKPAGQPCPHLGISGACGVYHARKTRGFTGCIGYSCYGAGQRVTQELFGGRSWQDDPLLLAPMIDAFRWMRLVHELLMLLEAAGKLPLCAADRREHTRLVAELKPVAGWTHASLAAFETGPLQSEVRTFLRSLRTYVPR